jgi:DNA-binding transcriptional ArsR family regulator
MSPHDPTRSTLTTATAMRVLAHPTRLRLLGLLRERGAQTATLLGQVVDEAPGTISYHLGKLASIDLIEPADARGSDRRERWWQATTDLTSWEPAELLDDPDQFAAMSVLQKSVAHANAARYNDYVDAMPSLPVEWVAAAASGDRTLHLTVDELAKLRDDLEALVEKWTAASARHTDDDQPDVERVTIMYQAYRRP